MRSLVLACLLSTSLVNFACDSRRHVDTHAVKEELREREIRKISDAEIMAKAVEIGEKITATAQASLAVKLQQKIRSGGLAEAISYCNIYALPLVDSLSHQYEVAIKRVSLKARNKNDMPDSLEREILNAYAFRVSDSASLQSNIQPLEGDYYLFTKPIMLSNPLCLNCHGTPGVEMSEATGKLIQSKYPEDKATGYKMGELRGMWTVRIPKKKIILSL